MVTIGAIVKGNPTTSSNSAGFSSSGIPTSPSTDPSTNSIEGTSATPSLNPSIGSSTNSSSGYSVGSSMDSPTGTTTGTPTGETATSGSAPRTTGSGTTNPGGATSMSSGTNLMARACTETRPAYLTCPGATANNYITSGTSVYTGCPSYTWAAVSTLTSTFITILPVPWDLTGCVSKCSTTAISAGSICQGAALRIESTPNVNGYGVVCLAKTISSATFEYTETGANMPFVTAAGLVCTSATPLVGCAQEIGSTPAYARCCTRVSANLYTYGSKVFNICSNCKYSNWNDGRSPSTGTANAVAIEDAITSCALDPSCTAVAVATTWAASGASLTYNQLLPSSGATMIAASPITAGKTGSATAAAFLCTNSFDAGTSARYTSPLAPSVLFCNQAVAITQSTNTFRYSSYYATTGATYNLNNAANIATATLLANGCLNGCSASIGIYGPALACASRAGQAGAAAFELYRIRSADGVCMCRYFNGVGSPQSYGTAGANSDILEAYAYTTY
ncbi:hypothetical protein ABW19_dt0205040 [Dactylella cylindrospora]|nr:hypothetical protein ABW19_dt0205040 [Dactylella cylindrospora]